MERKHLVAAARDLNTVMELKPEIDVSKSISDIKLLILEAAEILEDKDPVADATRDVIRALKGGEAVGEDREDGETLTETKPTTRKAKAEKKTKEPKAKTERAPRASTGQVGEFSPIRTGTKIHALMNMASAGDTVDSMAAHYKVKRTDVLWYFRYSLRRDHGIDFRLGEDGKIELVPPTGKTLADCVIAKAA